LIDAVFRAGWRNVRIQRLRDVEWATALSAPWPLGWLGASTSLRVIADA
jgi:hypothetical protein